VSALSLRTIRIRRGAKHVPARYHGAQAVVLEERRLSFAPWLRVRFDDGHEQWVPVARTEEAS